MTSSDVDYVRGMIAKLYRLPNCAAGGPLHVIADDGNIADHFLDTWTWEENKHGYPASTMRLSQRIVKRLRALNPDERRKAIRYWN